MKLQYKTTLIKRRRIILEQEPYEELTREGFWGRSNWPASWIHHLDGMTTPGGWLYRLSFQLDETRKVLLHVTADELYELFIDGERIGRGPQRGGMLHWHFEAREIELAAGPHVLLARGWAFGAEIGPHGLCGLRPGFLLGNSPDLLDTLATGRAPWQVRNETGYEFHANSIGWGTGPEIVIDAGN